MDQSYIGERPDRAAGLQYLNARYYDPELALSTSPDWFAGGPACEGQALSLGPGATWRAAPTMTFVDDTMLFGLIRPITPCLCRHPIPPAPCASRSTMRSPERLR